MREFKKYFIINAPPDQVYLALTNPLTIRLWSGEPAEMSTEPDSEFSLWTDSIVGKNLEFEDGKKIIQHWYFGDQEVRSIVIIKLHAADQGTSMEVKQSNIPDEAYEDIVDGWNTIYAGALQEFYREG